MQPWPQQATPQPTCPHCGLVATPAPLPQACSGCGRRFAVYTGAALDPSRQLPPPDGSKIVVKFSGGFNYKFGAVEPYGVSQGTNDPIVAMIPIEQSGVGYPDIFTLTVWRKVAWGQLVLTLLVLVPLTLLFLYASVGAAGFLILALPFASLTAFALYGAVGIGAHYVRVMGRYRTIEIRFDKPMWRRRRFHDELLRRAGAGVAPIP